LQTDAIYDQLDHMQSNGMTTASAYSFIGRQADRWQNDRLKQLLGYF